MGLSAWKQYRNSRWALRVNPSSGNLHPTEAYLVRDGRVYHYAPREHALEERSALGAAAWTAFSGSRPGFLVGLTSIHWREAWKYGERAFRYCQHDAGHAIAALRFAAALLGWRLTLLAWTDGEMGAVLGVGRAGDYEGAEREEPECIAVVTPDGDPAWLEAPPEPLVVAARDSTWHGQANALSQSRVDWPIIDEVARATRVTVDRTAGSGGPAWRVVADAHRSGAGPALPRAQDVFLHRRSAVAFDARSSLPRGRFISMLQRTRPAAPPWDAIDWPPHVHLLLFVHRVDGLTPGVYAYLRESSVLAEWRAAMRPEFIWEPANQNDSNDSNGLYLLLPFDVTWVANRLSCDQDIAGDGFFSLGMIARVESSIRDHGEWFYRRLFWECGMIGQVLYLEAEAAGARATGIGCFYDDPVHEAAGLSGMEWQSLYHFSMGIPVEDGRLTTAPGYVWETADGSHLQIDDVTR